MFASTGVLIRFVGAGLERDPRAGLFSPVPTLVVCAAGLIGVWFAHRTAFPPAWGSGAPLRRRLLVPAAVGLGFGLLSAILDTTFHWTAAFAQHHALQTFNAPFPGSLLFYPGGAVLVEAFYRLLPIPLLLWLISSVVLRGRGQRQVFWALALLTSLIEPVTQDLEGLADAGLLLVATQFVPDYALNLVEAAAFRTSGLLSMWLVRVAMYLVWHVAYGNFICHC